MATFIPKDPVTHYQNFHGDVLGNGLLLLGSRDLVRTHEARTHLRTTLGCAHVLNAANDIHGADGDDRFKILRVNAIDVQGYDLSPAFERACDFIESTIDCDSPTPVYVHCQEGVSRSVTLVLAYLVARRRSTLSEAFDVVQKCRTFAQPNMSFWQQLVALERRVHGSVTCDCRQYVVEKLDYSEEIADRLLKDLTPEGAAGAGTGGAAAEDTAQKTTETTASIDWEKKYPSLATLPIFPSRQSQPLGAKIGGFTLQNKNHKYI